MRLEVFDFFSDVPTIKLSLVPSDFCGHGPGGTRLFNQHLIINL